MSSIKKPNQTRWLWWMALVVLAFGGLIVYFLYQDRLDPSYSKNLALTVMFSVIGAGLCIIAATSQWWLKR